MLIDTHAHLNDERYNNKKLFEIINNFEKEGLEKVITIGADIKTCNKNLEIVNNFNNIYCSVGIHPESEEEFSDENFKKIEMLAKNEKVVAIGEVGLDYHYDGFNKEKQIEGFVKQIKIAYKLKLPLIIHLRDATKDMLEVLNENKEYLKYGFVFHCFSESLETCKTLLKLGAYFSFTGNITYKNAKKCVEVIDFLPIDRIMLETDCPYLAPEPVRGTVNEPKNVKYVLKKICEIKNIDEIKAQEIIRNNVRNFYNI